MSFDPTLGAPPWLSITEHGEKALQGNVTAHDPDGWLSKAV